MSIKFLGTYPSWLPSSALNHSSWLLKIYMEEKEGRTKIVGRMPRGRRKGLRGKEHPFGFRGKARETTQVLQWESNKFVSRVWLP